MVSDVGVLDRPSVREDQPDRAHRAPAGARMPRLPVNAPLPHHLQGGAVYHVSDVGPTSSWPRRSVAGHAEADPARVSGNIIIAVGATLPELLCPRSRALSRVWDYPSAASRCRRCDNCRLGGAIASAALTSRAGSGRPASRSAMFCKVIRAIAARASLVKKAWW